tara:strand:+ start:2155 stop:3294 length:1140 start_codon:yes stop_codon:yes gene_type:complete
MELMERAQYWEARGRSVVHFEVGEPDFNTAAPIIEAGKRALDEGYTKYTNAVGATELREAIAAYYATLGASVDADRIVVTAGASGGLLLLAALLMNPGDELLITDPGYPCNEVFVRLACGEPRRIALDSDSGYQLSADLVRAHWEKSTRALLVASPANPTGAVMDAKHLRDLVETTHGLGGSFVLDEIYQGLTYAKAPGYSTGLAVHGDIVVLNSFSKYFGMTGWRLGWLVVPEAFVDGLTRLAQNLFISPSSIAQRAALAAFSEEAMCIHEERRQRFDARRGLLLEGLRELGFRVPVEPAGAFYIYADISGLGVPESGNSYAFCRRLIDEYQVAVTPGNDFGDVQARRFVRFAYTTDEASIREGLVRIGRACDQWARG